MKRLAIISTHPIQYNAPFFKAISDNGNYEVKVFYTWSQAKDKIYDPGFKMNVKWDIPLLEGYEYEFIKNISWAPGSHHFFGIINPSITAKVKKWKPDYLLVYGWSFLTNLYCLKYFKNKIPVLFRGDSILLDEQKGLKTFLRRNFLKWVYLSIDIALYVGKYNYDYYRKHNVPEGKLKYIPHSIDNERFQDTTLVIKQQLFASVEEKIKGKIVFLFVGKFEQKKDPVILIEAFKTLADKNCALVFVGDGELAGEMKNLSMPVPDIHYLPFQNQSNISEVYRLGDVLILPSVYNETWGLVVNEAMACGLAIIVSDKVGCSVDLVKNAENGFIFPAGDKTGLVAKMELMCNRDKLQKMKEASLMIIEDFSIRKNVDRLNSILTDIS